MTEYLGGRRHANDPDTKTLRVLACVKCGEQHTVDVTEIAIEAEASEGLREALEPFMREHRICGPKYDGCYSHWPWSHCRADGIRWPCDVEEIRAALAAPDTPPLPVERLARALHALSTESHQSAIASGFPDYACEREAAAILAALADEPDREPMRGRGAP